MMRVDELMFNAQLTINNEQLTISKIQHPISNNQ